jgi:ribosomal protein S27AE
MTTIAIYTCGHCGASVAKDATTCPHCHVRLAGIQCQKCHFAGNASDFLNDRCPRCGSHVVIAHQAKPRTPRAPGQKSPAAHAWASVVLPGLGTLLCGKTRRGLLILGLSALAMIGVNFAVAALTNNAVVGIGTWLALPLWVWGIVDGYRSAQQWNVEHPAQPGVPAATSPPLAAPAPPVSPDALEAKVDVEFDVNGKVTRIDIPQRPWTTSKRGDATFHTLRAASLLHASEALKKLSGIPGLTYFVVETPDGNLGRDLFGFYTEAPVKTSGIKTGSPNGVGATVEFARLSDSGQSLQQQRTIANLANIGKYARLVLMMECGRCGYESPVETESGSLVRQCYCCGATNTGIRGSIAVMCAPNVVVEI